MKVESGTVVMTLPYRDIGVLSGSLRHRSGMVAIAANGGDEFIGRSYRIHLCYARRDRLITRGGLVSASKGLKGSI
jgi:hypothetical protein